MFITNRELYYCKVMLLELKNTEVTYQRLFNQMLKDQIGWKIEVYEDDFLVKIKRVAKHVVDLKDAFEVLKKYDMELNSQKCTFGVVLGVVLRLHRVRDGG